MSRTFTDPDFLTWEVYPSAGDFGFSARPYLVFHCLTDRQKRPRQLEVEGDEADAEKLVVQAQDSALRDLLQRAEPVR